MKVATRVILTATILYFGAHVLLALARGWF